MNNQIIPATPNMVCCIAFKEDGKIYTEQFPVVGYVVWSSYGLYPYISTKGGIKNLSQEYCGAKWFVLHKDDPNLDVWFNDIVRELDEPMPKVVLLKK